MAKLSVIIPTYNAAAYLEATLAGILAQTGCELEVVVVDDGSQDDPGAVVASLRDERVRCLRLEKNHGGPSRPRNVGIEATRGDYVALVDADDLLLPGVLLRAVRFLDDHPELGLVFSRVLNLDPAGRLTPHLPPAVYTRFHALPRQTAGPGRWVLDRQQTFAALFHENFLLPSATVIPRRVLQQVGGFDERLTNADDRDLWLRIVRRYPFGFLDEYGIYYRVRPGSISTRGPLLAHGRVMAARKQLTMDLPAPYRLAARRLAARNLFSIGYYHQQRGETAAARGYFRQSMSSAPTLNAAKGWLLNLHPAIIPAGRLLKPNRTTARGHSFPRREGDLVSIVVTCYNYGHFLPGCLESLLAQTYANLEIIVVNDGSTDRTNEIMQPFQIDPRIRYVCQANGGQATAKNVGLRLAKGKFIAFLDADDLWLADKLSRQMPLFADPRVGVVYSTDQFIDPEGRLLHKHPRRRYLQPQRGKVTRRLFLDNFVPFSSAVVQRQALEEFGGFDESLPMGVDWDLWLKISTRWHFDFVDAPLLLYRIGHSGQMSQKIDLRHACSERIMERFLAEHPGEVDAATIRRARAYTCLNRGNFFCRTDPGKARAFYRQALSLDPLEWTAYKGILRLLGRP